MSILSIPLDAFSLIFSFIPTPQDLCPLRLVCSEFEQILFESTRVLIASKLKPSLINLEKFQLLNELHVSDMNQEFNIIMNNVIHQNQHLKHLVVERVMDRNAATLNLLPLSSLQYLRVESARFMHQIQLSQSCITSNLETLHLSRLAFSDFHFQALQQAGQATKLKVLRLSFCKNISNINLGEWCPNLITLDLSGTSVFWETVQNALQSCPKLNHLSVNHCETLTNSLAIENHSSLQSLSLVLCRRLYQLRVSNTPSLKFIDISKSPIHAECIESIMKCVNSIQTWRLSECYNAFQNVLSLNDEDPITKKKIVVPQQIQVFDGSLTMLDSFSLQNILMATSQTIKRLNLRETNISEIELDPFLEFPLLETLDVSVTSIDSSSFELFMRKATSLKQLIANQCVSISNDFYPRSASLEILSLRGCKFESQNFGKIAFSQCPNLKSLDLTLCDHLQNFEIASSQSLENLSLSSCTQISTLEIGNVPNLKSLNLSGLIALRRINPSTSHSQVVDINLSNSPSEQVDNLLVAFPNAQLTGVEKMSDIINKPNVTYEELNLYYKQVANLHTIHKQQKILDRARERGMHYLVSKIQSQIAHYRAIGGLNNEDYLDGIERAKEALQYWFDHAKDMPEIYFFTKYTFETLIQLYEKLGSESQLNQTREMFAKWMEAQKKNPDMMEEE